MINPKILAPSRKAAKVSDLGSKGAIKEDIAARAIVDAALKIHRALGPGLLESVYETVLEYELRQRKLTVARQVPIPIRYEAIEFDQAFRADLIVENVVVVEVKSVLHQSPVHKKQALTYTKLGGFRLGLLINFGAPLIKDGITRLVNRLPE